MLKNAKGRTNDRRRLYVLCVFWEQRKPIYYFPRERRERERERRINQKNEAQWSRKKHVCRPATFRLKSQHVKLIE